MDGGWWYLLGAWLGLLVADPEEDPESIVSELGTVSVAGFIIGLVGSEVFNGDMETYVFWTLVGIVTVSHLRHGMKNRGG